MYKIVSIALFILLIVNNGSSQNDPKVPLPGPAQLNWQNAELAVVFHYDLHVFDGKKYQQSNNWITPVPDYNIFNPVMLSTDQWIKAAKAAGARIAMLTVSHETGFSLYQSNVNPYCLKAVEWRDGKGDVVRDFVTSCRKYGLLPGLYIGIRFNSFFGVNQHKINGTGQFAENRQKYYNKMVEGMVKELFSRYGDLSVVWFDGGASGPGEGGPDILPIAEKYQPGCLFYNNTQRSDMRWGGSESGTVPYPCWGNFPFYSLTASDSIKRALPENNFALLKTGKPDGQYYMPAFSDAPLRSYKGHHDWFWDPDSEEGILPLPDLVKMYYNSVGHNSTLIIGLTPDANGLMPEADVKRLQEFGKEIKKRFDQPVASASGAGNRITLKLEKKQKINQLVLMEEIEQGERVRKFNVEGKTAQGWKPIVKGSCVGHKFIYQFNDTEVSAVRLNITASAGEPQILSFTVYRIENKELRND
jgi:alpha-L-fucosidase